MGIFAMREKKHLINGVLYTIDVDHAFEGLCDPPDGELERAIRLPDGLPADGPHAKKALCLLLHEVLHASNWDARENTVKRVAKDVSGLLWKLGYRRKRR